MAIPLELFVQVTDAQGIRHRWGAEQPPGSRPRNLSFRTKVGEGFSDANLQLSRRIERDYPDIDLLNDLAIVGADGSVAYEGRISAMPRDLAEGHSIGVQTAGWMAHTKDRKFTEIYVDRDLSAWGPASRGRRLLLMTSNLTTTDPSQAIDPTDSAAGVSTSFTGAWTSPYTPISEAWYDAGPTTNVGLFAVTWKREDATTVPTAGAWTWRQAVAADDKLAGGAFGANLLAAGPSTSTFSTPAGTTARYAVLQFFNTSTPNGADGVSYGIGWYTTAVYGAHGLSRYTGEPGQPAGVLASDVITNIAQRFCPLLKTSGVQASSYVIQHLTFKDRVFPYDAFLEVNKFHLWHLGVWENKTLTFRPYDLTDYVWEVRTDDPGTAFSAQGPTTDDLANGIAVTYTDVLTGVKNVLTPDVYPELRDTSSRNPWNTHQATAWQEIELSSPTLQSQALQVGRAALADRNTPKAPGQITVHGYIRDRAGNDQPVWRVRAGDTIAITNFPNDKPRLIEETSYDDETKTVTISVDAPSSGLDALFDRVSSALAANNLSNVP